MKFTAGDITVSYPKLQRGARTQGQVCPCSCQIFFHFFSTGPWTQNHHLEIDLNEEIDTLQINGPPSSTAIATKPSLWKNRRTDCLPSSCMREGPSLTGWPWQRQREPVVPLAWFCDWESRQSGSSSPSSLHMWVCVSFQHEDVCSQWRSVTSWSCTVA